MKRPTKRSLNQILDILNMFVYRIREEFVGADSIPLILNKGPK